MVHAVLVGAGRGERFGSPKQLAKVGGKTVIEMVTETFSNHPRVDEVILVVSEDILDDVRSLVKNVRLVVGGTTRTESVKKGLDAIRDGDDDVVLIHDVARPLVSFGIIDANLDAVKRHDVVCTAVDVVDTIAIVEEDQILKIPDRSKLKALQTPQTFRLKVIKRAHELASSEGLSFTDDCSTVLHYRLAIPKIVAGDLLNVKITYPIDLQILELILKTRSV